MNTQPAETPIQTPDRLIALAIEHGADVDRLGKLMDLQERWEKGQARRAFFDALSTFQSSVPNIPKTKEVKNRDGSARYKYAPLDAIIKTLREPLREHGFSYRWQTEHLEDALIVTCFLTHKLGHEESVAVTIPGITGHGTNAAQDEGSAISYGKRYSLTNILGIQPDDDDDGEASGPNHALRLIQMMEVVRDNLDTIRCVKSNLAPGGDKEAAAEAFAEFTRPQIKKLNIAPSKGGVWTTEERNTINRDPEFVKMVHDRHKDSGWYDNPENEH